MRKYKYVGTFKNSDGHTYTSEVVTNGLICAFFLLTANAINCGTHYQLSTIVDEKGSITDVDDILKVGNLLKIR